MSRYLIGIDLGTTNSALAYVDLQRKPKAGRPEVETFAIPQLTAPGELARRALLPSFLYLPGAHDLPPGSFDEMARNLTVDAARQAGMENLTLLEEPQAAFYCWLWQSTAGTARLKPGTCCLVVDVGGGTTDLSLIRAVEQEGELGFVRE